MFLKIESFNLETNSVCYLLIIKKKILYINKIFTLQIYVFINLKLTSYFYYYWTLSLIKRIFFFLFFSLFQIYIIFYYNFEHINIIFNLIYLCLDKKKIIIITNDYYKNNNNKRNIECQIIIIVSKSHFFFFTIWQIYISNKCNFSSQIFSKIIYIV